MTTYINVARYHLVHRVNYLILPWAILAFVFAVDAIILAVTPAGQSSHRYVGGLASIFVIVFVLGVQSVARSLPFSHWNHPRASCARCPRRMDWPSPRGSLRRIVADE